MNSTAEKLSKQKREDRKKRRKSSTANLSNILLSLYSSIEFSWVSFETTTTTTKTPTERRESERESSCLFCVEREGGGDTEESL